MPVVANRSWRLGVLVRGVVLVLLLTSCDKEDKITVENFIQEPANQPPLIVEQGPDLPPGGLEVLPFRSPQLYVLVGDPNGLDDISLVSMSIDSIRVSRFRLRPNVSPTSCFNIGFAPNETLSTELILTVPHTFTGVEFQPLHKAQGGLYRSESFQVPDMLSAATNVRQWPGGCGDTSDGILYPWIVEPPAAPTDTIAAVTLAEVHYYGITVTVHDKVGASATTTFPDWHLTFLTEEEQSELP